MNTFNMFELKSIMAHGVSGATYNAVLWKLINRQSDVKNYVIQHDIVNGTNPRGVEAKYLSVNAVLCYVLKRMVGEMKYSVLPAAIAIPYYMKMFNDISFQESPECESIIYTFYHVMYSPIEEELIYSFVDK